MMELRAQVISRTEARAVVDGAEPVPCWEIQLAPGENDPNVGIFSGRIVLTTLDPEVARHYTPGAAVPVRVGTPSVPLSQVASRIAVARN